MSTPTVRRSLAWFAPFAFPRLDRSSMICCRMMVRCMQADMRAQAVAQSGSEPEEPGANAERSVTSYARQRTLRLIVPRAGPLEAWSQFKRDVEETCAEDGDEECMVDVAVLQWEDDASTAAALSAHLNPTLFVAPDSAYACRVLALVAERDRFRDVSAVLCASPGLQVEHVQLAAQRMFSVLFANPDLALDNVDAATAMLVPAYVVARSNRHGTSEFVVTGVDARTGVLTGRIPDYETEQSSDAPVVRMFPACGAESMKGRVECLYDAMRGCGVIDDEDDADQEKAVRRALRI